jgi:hypothetical protein
VPKRALGISGELDVAALEQLRKARLALDVN